MVKNVVRLLILALSILSLGCGESSLQSLGSQFSILNQYTKPATFYGVYYQPSDLTLPPFKVADFDSLETTGVLPNNLIKNEYGDRTAGHLPQPFNYFIRNIKINSQFDNGDFFFESPILSAKYELNAGATALTQILKYTFVEPIVLSRVRWEEILLQVELGVGNITTLSTSQIIKKILEKPNLLNSIQNLVRTQNPTVTVKIFSPPQFLLAWSNPPLAPNEKSKAIKQIVNEDSEAFLWLVFWNPLDSKNRIFPDTWKHVKNDASVLNLGPQETYIYKFDFNSQGDHVITASKTIDSVLTNFEFSFEVLNENILPEWAEGLQLTFIENHTNNINLEQLSAGLPGATDPDGGVLLYSLVNDTSAPSGMIVKLEEGVHYLSWSPDGGDPSLVRSGEVKLVAQDPDGGSVAVSIPYVVVPDSLPVITTIPTTWTLSEGVEGSFIIETQDGDADPVMPECTLTTSPGYLTFGAPSGSGMFTFTEEAGSVLGHQIFKAALIPSYMETIGSDKAMTFQCTLNYYGEGLVSLDENDPHVIEASLTNMDDPPSWIAGASFVDPTVTENTPFAGLAVGTVSDPSPNPTAMTYTVAPFGYASGCSWDADHGGDMVISETIVGSDSELTLSGTPIFASDVECTFVITATDANGLSSQSGTFTLTTIDTNRPPEVVIDPAPETTYEVDEGKILQIPVATFFTDIDLTENDPRELLWYSCNECGAITEINFDSSSGSFSWTPTANRADASPYTFTFVVHDKGGATASLSITVTVIDTPAPALLSLNSTFFKVNELSGAVAVELTITAASSMPIDAFSYNLNASGNCRPGLIDNSSGITSGITTDAGEVISFVLNPNRTTDGNAPFPGLNKSCLMTFSVTKDDDPTVTSSVNLPITVTNVNRAPNAVVIGGDSNIATYNLNLTAGPNDYISGIWIKTNKVNVGVNDSDATEDPVVDSFSFTSGLGTVSNGQWSFKLPNCLRYESGKISTLNTTVTANDGRGGELTRSVKITVTNARNLGCN